MASIQFTAKGKQELKKVYVRLTNGRSGDFRLSTGYVIHHKEWSEKKGMPAPKSAEARNLALVLNELKAQIVLSLNEARNKGEEINSKWLKGIINKSQGILEPGESDRLEVFVQWMVDNADKRPNQKGGLGISESRKGAYLNFLQLVQAWKKAPVLIRDIDIKFADEFQDWLLKSGYSLSYASKNIGILKAVCAEAERREIKVNPVFRQIKKYTKKKDPSEIVYLNLEEQEAIARLLLPEGGYLDNARLWLLLGCQLGQRFGDLMTLDESMIKEIRGAKVVEFRQSKTEKLVVVPLNSRAKQILEKGVPRPLNNVNFNRYIKEVCQRAGIDNVMRGSLRVKDRKGAIEGLYPKYKLVGSHVCRRSFASNYYGKIPTNILKDITGHSTEKMLLTYIGKTSYDSALALSEYFKHSEN